MTSARRPWQRLKAGPASACPFSASQRCRRLTALGVFLLGAFTSVRGEFAIRWTREPPALAVEVEGIPREALTILDANRTLSATGREILAVYAEQPYTPGTARLAMPPIAGAWRITGAKLRFEPRFPLVGNVTYRAEFHPSRLPAAAMTKSTEAHQQSAPRPNAAPVISYYELPPAAAGVGTRVVQIFPSGDVVPENQLKFYVLFSGPMSRGGIYEHVELRECGGGPIELPFLELDEELWDPAMTRLTLLIDPGRIKRGVKPLEDIGPVFEAGKTYTLAVKASWRDAAGRPLEAGYEKTFRAVAADRTPPDPRRWTFLSVPAAGTSAPLVVGFDEPLDHALARRLIGVHALESADAPRASLAGDVFVDENERRWRWQPAASWRPGRYALVVATTIEDLAGNNIGKAFDVELAEGARRPAAETVSVPFEVR